jgi:glycosyltransferase involved in cell wall biosynthesis
LAPEEMAMGPRVVIGVPIYNGGAHVAEALRSLRSQTYSDFELVIVDDCSTDGTAELVSAYAAEDARVHFVRNETRVGLVGNWRRTFALADELHPDLEYFAWGSDHDIWHPRWLESLVAELEARPEAVLAYPRMGTIGESGEPLRRQPRALDTTGVDDPRRRAELTWQAGRFGYRVYGLFRARALKRCGVLRDVYVPDRLLLFELALHGRFREVPEVLWHRRRTGGASVERQRAAFFPDRRPPLKFRVPWRYSHSAILFWSLAVRGRARPGVSRREGAGIAARYLHLARAHKASR